MGQYGTIWFYLVLFGIISYIYIYICMYRYRMDDILGKLGDGLLY